MKFYINLKIILLLICLSNSINSIAYDFEVDGIRYNKLSDSEVEVTFNPKKKSGLLNLPSKVTYNGIEYSVISIGAHSFYECFDLVGPLVIPNSITSIKVAAFGCCSGLTGSLTIPDQVKYIGASVFYGCSGFDGTLTIPNSVTSIGSNAFEGCRGFSTFISKIENPFSIDDSVFGSISSNAVLIVPNGTKNKYLKYSGWTKNFKEIIEEGNYTQTYLLSIKATGNGSASYNGISIKNNTQSFTVNEGISATISFTPDTGYRIKSVKLNNTDVTSSVSGNSYSFSSISADTMLEVEFDAISATTYNLSMTASGNGQIVCPNDVVVRNETKVFPFEDGGEFNFQVIADEGYTYTLSNTATQAGGGISGNGNNWKIHGIKKDASVTVKFKESTKYNLTIKSTGKGSVSFEGTTVRNNTSSISVYAGTTATISFSPDNGYRIKNVIINNKDVTSSISNGKYTIPLINSNTTVAVEFEAIPPTTYTLSIKATGNGSASYNGTTIRAKTNTFTVNEGTSVTISITPDNGCRIKSVKENNTNVTSYVSNGKYTISSISRDTNVEVEFEAIPPTTYTLSIKATGNGSASYNGTTIRSKTSTFTVNEGTSAIISFAPDNGYRIKSVKVNNADVTTGVSNNQYTINNISANTTVEVVFEAIPVTTYTLSITATGNGSASYDGNTVRSKTTTFTVNEGASATIMFSPDDGYRIKSVKVNSTNVTSSVSNNQYTISNITANTTLEVEFEAIPVTTYTLSIKSTGDGFVSYNGTAFRGKTRSFTVNEGTKVSISLTPDNGCRIKSVKENDTDVTSYVSNGTYTINSISRNTTVEVEFETIPSSTYSLSITATGYGTVTYDYSTIRNNTYSYALNEGELVTILISPDSGYRIKSVKENGSDVTAYVSNNRYTISSISRDTNIEVEFEAIPVPTYALSITATGNGSVTYDGTAVRSRTTSFTVNEGTDATITFSPDNGNSIASVKLNNSDVTSLVSGNRYTINNITANTTLEVTFQEDVNALTVDGVNYAVVSQTDRTVKVTGGDFGQVLTVPATVTQNGKTWTVTGIDTNALKNNTELAAVIWNPTYNFTATVSNPNLLLYVKSSSYAPSSIQNVVVNGTASNIVLAEAQSGNNFCCPQAFVAQKISYTHNYQMQTGVGESKGWETIALPFDVQTITHETKGTIVPFAQWNNDSNKNPFWLMELTGTGFVEAGSIKAYTPYIISMPNHPQYDSQWLLKGKVTFAASNVTVGKTENLNQSVFNGRTFIPCFTGKKADEGFYALNVSNDWDTNNSGMTEGSKFVLNMRKLHPFEAYMISSSNAAPYFDVFEDMTTGIQVMDEGRWMKEEAVYDLQGRKVENPSKKGVYIVNGKKKIIK